MPEVRVLQRIGEIDPSLWDACCPGALETHAYLRAVESADLPGFSYCYLVATEAGTPVAAAPVFFTDYALDTTMTGVGRRIVGWVRRAAPRLLTLRLACIGSPCTETASVGIAAHLPAARRADALRALVSTFESEARSRGAGLMAVRDAPVTEKGDWDDALRTRGYACVPGMPIAKLRIDFGSIDDYMARLSRATRKDMRRKLRAFSQIRIEERQAIGDALPRVKALYDATRARSDLQFEELTSAYFENVLAMMPDRSLCTLYYEGNDLLGFNLLLEDETTLLDKFFCMEGERARALNLYYLSWFNNVRRCIATGRTCYQSGQAAYDNKLRLGSTLTQTAMYFRHRNPVLSKAMQLAAPFFLASDSFGDISR